jgi:hypothetical protein
MFVEITPRNCVTGEPIPTAGTKALYTFHEDGTMSVSFLNNSLALERTAAHGLMQRDLGWSEYSFKFIHYDAPVRYGPRPAIPTKLDAYKPARARRCGTGDPPPAHASRGPDTLRLVPSSICQIFNRRICQIFGRR